MIFVYCEAGALLQLLYVGNTAIASLFLMNDTWQSTAMNFSRSRMRCQVKEYHYLQVKLLCRKILQLSRYSTLTLLIRNYFSSSTPAFVFAFIMSRGR
jgi:hypothetical protein